MAPDGYSSQVGLLVRVLPIIAREPMFALKGGTAINLFYRDLPRLSVDIDLTYLPIADRGESLEDIDRALGRIAKNISARHNEVSTRRIDGGGGSETRLQVRHENTIIKIEISPVARGTVLPPSVMRVTDVVEEKYGFAEIQVVSFEDLYGGKLHAALDRQHPRDFFDIKLLYDHEGLTDELFRVFLVYVAGSNRPIHELLNPNWNDMKERFEREFVGMTSWSVGKKDLENVRNSLIVDIQSRLMGSTAEFLRSLQSGEPDFELIGHSSAAELPAVRWKQINIARLISANPNKHREQTAALSSLLR